MTDDDLRNDQVENAREIHDDRVEREYRRIEEEESKSGEDTLNRSGRSTGTSVDRKDEEQLDVPQVAVENDPRPEIIEQNTESPTDVRQVQVPQIRTSSGSMLDTDEMKDSVLINSELTTVDMPQFALDGRKRVPSVELDEKQLEGIGRVQQVQIPQIRLPDPSRVHPFDTFSEIVPEADSEDVDNKVEMSTEKSEEEQIVEDIRLLEESAGGISESDSGGGKIADKWPDPLELLVGSGSADIQSDKPMVVLVDDDALIGVVETLLIRRYREIEGGEPQLQKFDTAEQLADEERWISADGRIFTVRLPDEEWTKMEGNEYQDEWRSIWSNRIDQLFSGQRFGAIVFNRRKLPTPEIISLPYHPPKKVELEEEVVWREVARLFWTNLEGQDSRRSRTFSQVFNLYGNGIAEDYSEQVLGALDGKFAYATDRDEAASDEHYVLKVFVVRWLVQELWESGDGFAAYDDLADVDYGVIEETVQTEKRMGDHSIRPDVKYGPQVFEVEMFFGEGDQGGVESKLQETVRKYESVKKQIDTINIVVDNLTCILHLKDLARFKRNHQWWMEEYININIYTSDLASEELVPISDLVEKMDGLASE